MQENLGERIARIRRESGLTQSQLAERLYVTPQAVSKWERGLSLPDAEMLGKIAGVLGRGTDELLGLPGQPVRKAAGQVSVSRPESKGRFSVFRFVLGGSLGFYFLVFFLGLLSGADAGSNSVFTLFLILPFPVSLLSFLLCRERRRSGWIGRAAGIVQAGYLVLHTVLFWISDPILNAVILAWDVLFMISLLIGFEFKRGYAVPLYRAVSFWISVVGVALYLGYAIWSALTATGLTDLSEIFSRVMIGEWLFMILLTLLTFTTEPRIMPD